MFIDRDGKRLEGDVAVIDLVSGQIVSINGKADIIRHKKELDNLIDIHSTYTLPDGRRDQAQFPSPGASNN